MRCSSSPSAATSASSSAPPSCCCWWWRRGADPRPPGAGRADGPRPAARPRAARARPQGPRPRAPPPWRPAAPALPRPPAPAAQGGGAGRERVVAVPRRALRDLRRHLGRGRPGADLRHRAPVQLGGRPDRDRGPPGLGPVLPGAGRHGRRHQLRRHRQLARGDDREPGRAGHAARRLHPRPVRRDDATRRHRRVRADARRGPAGLARALARGAGHGGAGRERPRPGRQPDHPPRAHHGPRGDGARVFRPAPRHGRAGGGAQAHDVPVADRLRLPALRHGARRRRRRPGPAARARRLPRQARPAGRDAGPVRGHHRQDAGVPGRRVPRRGPDAGLPRRAPPLRLAGHVMTAAHGLAFDLAHLLAGGMVVVSFTLLYQDRMFALLRTFALHAGVLAAAVAWQAWIQDAPHLFVTAAIALLFKAVFIPVALRRIVVRLGIHREIEPEGGVGPTRLAGLGLTALAILVTLPVTAAADPLAREDIAFALAVVLLGLLMMIARGNAVSQVVGFMSLENGLILAATGAKGMPLVVELSVAFSVLIAFIVFGVFVFRIRERFDTVDVHALDRFRGDQAHG